MKEGEREGGKGRVRDEGREERREGRRRKQREETLGGRYYISGL